MPTPHRIPHHIADLPLRGQRNNLNLLNYFRIRILRISHRSTLLSTQLHPSLSLSNTHENKPEQEIWGGNGKGSNLRRRSRSDGGGAPPALPAVFLVPRGAFVIMLIMRCAIAAIVALPRA